jgi:hypothetical protein
LTRCILKWIGLSLILLIGSGCAGTSVMQPAPVPDKPAPAVKSRPIIKPKTRVPDTAKPGPYQLETPLPESPRKTDRPKPKPTPQLIASLTLVDQARVLIDSNRPDDAIRLLERAVNLHPQNGQTYYYLAEAWLKKGDILQAGEFHRLAGVYLKYDGDWSSQLKLQEQKIKDF